MFGWCSRVRECGARRGRTTGGSLTINNGSGPATTSFDGNQASLPVVIGGNLTLTGSGANTVTAGSDFQHPGLMVGKNLTVATGAAADTLTFKKLEVGGTTTLLLGDGDNAVTIDDSAFVGRFTLTTGSGNDSVSLDHTANTSAPTIFVGPVLIVQGAGNNSLARAGFDDANEELICLSTFVVHHGASAVWFHNDSQDIFPFGGSIQWVP
jgi:hypothetical protein